MAYFDFHLHPAFKKFICEFEEEYPSTRLPDTMLGEIDMKHFLIDFLEEHFLHILESQSCIQQLEKADFNVGVAGIAPIEEVFTSRNGIFGRILNDQTLTRPLDQKYFRKIRDWDISYYQLFIKELNIYKRLRDHDKLHLLNRKASLNGISQLKAGTMSFAIGIEGGHSLCRTKIHNPSVLDKMIVTDGSSDAFSDDFVKNPSLSPAKSLEHLQQAAWDEGMDILYLIMTHLSYIHGQHIATHAYGMKLLDHNDVLPAGNGLSELGYDLVKSAYNLKVRATVNGEEQTVPAPVLIDIKHLGLKSRLDFYNYRKEIKAEKLPIIASHMGVTGYSIEEWKGALKKCYVERNNETPVVGIEIDRREAGKWGLINNTFTFNAWSINLMDDDIIEILKSKGLIGLSLDVRILGWQPFLGKGDKDEFLSWEDFRFFFPDEFGRLFKSIPGDAESFVKPTKEERHTLSLCFNILHIIYVGSYLMENADPWKHICIGSDYDGLIDPLIQFRDAETIPELEKLLIKWLPVADEAYCKENSISSLLPRANRKLDLLKLRQSIKDLLYENGKRFMEDWLLDSFGSRGLKIKKPVSGMEVAA